MKNIVKKSVDSGNANVCITERGTSFGYNTLVTDMRGLPQMARDTGCPVIFDATHSVQQPGGLGGSSGGQASLRRFWLGRQLPSAWLPFLSKHMKTQPSLPVTDRI